MRLQSYSAKRPDRYWQKPLGIFFAQVVKREVCSTRVMSPSDALWALWKAIAMARAGLFQTILFKRWRSFMHGPNVSKYEKTQTHRDSNWNGCGEIWQKKNPAFEISPNRQQIPDRLFSMLIPSPSAVFLRILGVALLEHWTMFFEFSTCHSSVHALRLVFANGFNEITHSTNKYKIILERKSVCHGFVAAGVFKRFGFEASRGWRLSFLLMLGGEVPDVFCGFRWVFLDFAMRNRLPIMHQKKYITFASLRVFPHDHLHEIGSSHMFLPVPHLLLLGPTAIAAFLGCRRFLKKDRRNFLKRPWNPAQLHFRVFGESGATVCYQKWKKKQCFNWGCPSNFRSSFVFLPDRFGSYCSVFFLVPNFKNITQLLPT